MLFGDGTSRGESPQHHRKVPRTRKEGKMLAIEVRVSVRLEGQRLLKGENVVEPVNYVSCRNSQTTDREGDPLLQT